MTSPLIVSTPGGTPWNITSASWKLSRRAELPGARLFDLTADAIRHARDAGLSMTDRLAFARTGSWLVNSPVHVRVLRRWALAPSIDRWLALTAALEGGPARWLSGDTRAEVTTLVASLGEEPQLVESVSKVLALIFPETVPLMPELACRFVQKDIPQPATVETFAAMLDWFAEAVTEHEAALRTIAQSHEEVTLEPAQVLDRLLWFDSDGKHHFPPSP